MDTEEPRLDAVSPAPCEQRAKKPRFSHISKGSLMPAYDSRKRARKKLLGSIRELIWDDHRKAVMAYWPRYDRYGELLPGELRASVRSWLSFFNSDLFPQDPLVHRDRVRKDLTWFNEMAWREHRPAGTKRALGVRRVRRK